MPPKYKAQRRTRVVPAAKSLTIDTVFLSAAMKRPMPLTRNAETVIRRRNRMNRMKASMRRPRFPCNYF